MVIPIIHLVVKPLDVLIPRTPVHATVRVDDRTEQRDQMVLRQRLDEGPADPALMRVGQAKLLLIEKVQQQVVQKLALR
jgi:hypothetical protein